MYLVTSDVMITEIINQYWHKVRNELSGNVGLRPVSISEAEFPFFIGLTATNYNYSYRYIDIYHVIFTKNEAKRIVYSKTNSNRGSHRHKIINDKKELENMMHRILEIEKLKLVGRQLKFYTETKANASNDEAMGTFPILLAWIKSDLMDESAVEFFYINKTEAKNLVYYDKPDLAPSFKVKSVSSDAKRMFMDYLREMYIMPRSSPSDENPTVMRRSQELYNIARSRKRQYISQISRVMSRDGLDASKAFAMDIAAEFADLLNNHTKQIDVLRETGRNFRERHRS